MFKNSYQNGLLSIFYSCGAHPLAIWDMEVNNGHIKRLTDLEVNSIVLEIVSTNVSTTYISCPKNNQVLGIRLPFLIMILKNLKRYFTFEITVLDDKMMRRRFRISNFQTTTKIKPFCTTMPIGLSTGWNQIQFNLSDFTRRAYGTQFIETLKVQVNANARLRRIYFSDRLYTEAELPQEYKLYLPIEGKKKEKKEVIKVSKPSKIAASELVVVKPVVEPAAEIVSTEGAPIAEEIAPADEGEEAGEKEVPVDTISGEREPLGELEALGEEQVEDGPTEPAEDEIPVTPVSETEAEGDEVNDATEEPVEEPVLEEPE